jgi:hypothetical protein
MAKIKTPSPLRQGKSYKVASASSVGQHYTDYNHMSINPNSNQFPPRDELLVRRIKQMAGVT